MVKLNVSDPRTAEAKAKYDSRARTYFVLLDGEGRVVNTWQGYADKAYFDGQFSAVLGR
jgi:thioredoxin-related protein